MVRIYCLVCLVFLSCETNNQRNPTRALDFGRFSIEVPQHWSKIEHNGVDSYVGGIRMSGSDSIEFDIGWYSNNLYEYDPSVIDSSMLEHIDTTYFDTSEVIVVKNRNQTDFDRYRTGNVSWDSIDGHKAKLVYPRVSGKGVTGIYIDSFSVRNGYVTKFNLYGTDLLPENEALFRTAIQTLRFRRD